ncbi:eb57d3ae-26a4-4f2f-8a15-40b3bba431ff [Thermothielavioides terrestris]|uniref:Eb57d3ae-26a4-4f2f-8a15-40b3bba431ff n=1 Tax=Thermothielavioides terrestris TaxID=2587410 RepID=A0A3S4BGJ5_9PEZI|nr:eb57d3ae-26a4-4f2f-8a15-40b3bba431ff [Thermothielavioides terrestris]
MANEERTPVLLVAKSNFVFDICDIILDRFNGGRNVANAATHRLSVGRHGDDWAGFDPLKAAILILPSDGVQQTVGEKNSAYTYKIIGPITDGEAVVYTNFAPVIWEFMWTGKGPRPVVDRPICGDRLLIPGLQEPTAIIDPQRRGFGRKSLRPCWDPCALPLALDDDLPPPLPSDRPSLERRPERERWRPPPPRGGVWAAPRLSAVWKWTGEEIGSERKIRA